MEVTRKQDQFVRRYLIDYNATKAAMEIGYSKKSARQIGYQLLTKLHIQEHIEKVRKEMEGKYNVTLERMLQELTSIAYSNVSRILNDDGSIKDIHSLSEEDQAAIASIEVDEITEYIKGQKVVIGQSKKVKNWDKLRAMDMIAKIQGYISTLKISGTDDKGKPIKEFKVTLNL